MKMIIDFAKRFKMLRILWWRFRKALKIQRQKNQETFYWLQQTHEILGDSKTREFHFPWGKLEYVSIVQLRSQYEEIYIQHQYAYRPSSSNAVIVDCGGNVGLSAIWFRQTYPGCQLTVFEADSDLAAILKRNLAHANCNDVLVRNEAVWIETGPVTFRKTGDDSGKIDASGLVSLPAVDIAECLPAKVDLLKLDIEGAEYAVLNRLCDTGIIMRIRCLICEFHVWRERTGDFLEVLDKLDKSGMKLSMTGGVTPWIGLAKEEAPFEVIKQNHVLMEVYAWRTINPQ